MNDMKKILSKDIYRYYGKYTLSWLERLKMSNELKIILSYRKTKQCVKMPIIGLIYRKKHSDLCKKMLCQIPYNANIGEGMYIGHLGNIYINPEVVIGKNVNIAQGVTLGQENRGSRKGCPSIGDKVWIGANAVVVGNIKIGNDVLIAPNTFVNFDVPSHSIVVGNPGKIISRENATENYINRIVD